jgi:CheY-like chemotaxis protein
MGTSLKRILLVDDEPDILTVARHVLEALGGFTVVPCESGREALRQAPVFRPDLIMLDVMMPVMDGLQTLEALRDLPAVRTTPVVFMSARVQRHEVAEYKACGAQAVIEKPFDPMTLHDRLCAIWARHAETADR